MPVQHNPRYQACFLNVVVRFFHLLLGVSQGAVQRDLHTESYELVCYLLERTIIEEHLFYLLIVPHSPTHIRYV